MLYLRPFSIKLHGRAVMQAPPKNKEHLLTFLLSLRLQVCHPTTRIFVALLGPCFKTGRLRQFCQQPFNSHLQSAVPDLTAKVLEVKPRPLIAKPNAQTTSKEPSSPHSQATWPRIPSYNTTANDCYILEMRQCHSKMLLTCQHS